MEILAQRNNCSKDKTQTRGECSITAADGVCQWCPTGSVLFINMYIKGLEKGESSEVTKFAVDTQLFKVVRMKADCEELQKDLKRLCDWAIK